uniref:Uncharacterized protein n=1 Tax=Panagrolaimus superbus TaxID=310955 RepID=A0A914XWN5_9BILA
MIKKGHEFILDALDKWEDVARKIKDADKRKLEYENLDIWRDDDGHQKLLKDVAMILLIGEEYLIIDDDENYSIKSDSTVSTQNCRVTASVPQINMPKFNGDYLKWTPFWQRFEHAIHSGPYPKIEKLISLLGFLEGRALEEVEGFTVAAENYDTIVDTIQNRFGNRTLIILELQEKLRGIETARSNPESLRSTINLICNMCRQLQNLVSSGAWVRIPLSSPICYK